MNKSKWIQEVEDTINSCQYNNFQYCVILQHIHVIQ